MRRIARKADVNPFVRLLTTIYLSDEEFSLLSSLPGSVLTKTRHHVGTVNGVEVSIDEFSGDLAGLIMAEAEFDDMQTLTSYPMPEFAFAEVTHDPRYRGSELVANGLPKI